MNDHQIEDLFDAPPTAAEQHAQKIRDEVNALDDAEMRAGLVMQRLEIERLRAALSELVTLNNTAASLPVWPLSPDPDIETRMDLDRRQPLAWIAARKALGLQP